MATQVVHQHTEVILGLQKMLKNAFTPLVPESYVVTSTSFQLKFHLSSNFSAVWYMRHNAQ